MLTYTAGEDNARICAEAVADHRGKQITVWGLSTDEKPIGLPNATVFYEMNTKKVFMYDAEGAAWLEQ